MPPACQPAPAWGSVPARAVLNGAAGTWVGVVNRQALNAGAAGQALCEFKKVGALSFNFPVKPDDDVMVTVAGRVVYDTRRNIGWYTSPLIINLTAEDAGIQHGDTVRVYTFDGWQGQWVSTPWTARVTWSDGMVSNYAGGSNSNGISRFPFFVTLPPNYFITGPWFIDYIPNGSFRALHPSLPPA